MIRPVSTLVTFAVQEEARPFQARLGPRADVVVLVTGMGRRRAKAALLNALQSNRPIRVLTCGFAGGLDPDLPSGTVVFSADPDFDLTSALARAGARAVRFHCADRVLPDAEQKRLCRETTGADAVEMESAVIREHCLEVGIPSATIRVISDAADEDLPLDFNQYLDADFNLKYGRLALGLMASPGKAPGLMRFQRRIRGAAERLAAVLADVIPLYSKSLSK